MKKVILILFVLTNFSCSVHNYNNDMRKCINENYIIWKKNIGFSNLEKPIVKNDFDIFKSIKKFETTLINANLLKDNSEQSYKNLIENKIESFDKKKIIETTKFKNPYMYSLHKGYAFVYDIFYNSCPYNIVIKRKGAIAYYPTKAVFEKIIEYGYPTKEHLKELLKVTDFKDETSRLLLCNLIYDNWYDWKGDIRTSNDVEK